MGSCFATFAAALFWLLAAAFAAPAGTGVQGACADVRNSSLELNRRAYVAATEAGKGDKSESNFTSSLAWMDAKDLCDPVNLKKSSSTCIVKMLSVLKNYISYVERISGYASCSQSASRVKEPLRNLLGDMDKCVNSRMHQKTYQEPTVSTGDMEPFSVSLEPLVCRYTLDRLFSFSIIAARVFAVGDPADHGNGSAQECL